MRSTIFTQLVLILVSLSLVQAHTWVELLRTIANNGSFVGAEGYPRGFVSRQDPKFNDTLETWQIEANGTDPTLCHRLALGPNTQGTFPRLQSSPGDMVALLYQENGHVSLPDVNPGKPANRGTVYIYATQQEKDDEKYYDVYQKWNTAGTVGDKRGKLISTQNFDDGQCFQVNPGQISKTRQAEHKFTASNPMGSDLWCQNNIQIPKDVDTSKLLSLYWIWKWDTAPGVDPNIKDGKNQTYTSCMDIELKPATTNKKSIQFKYATGQDPQDGSLPGIFDKLKTGNVFAVTDYTDGMSPTASNTPINPTTAGVSTVSQAQSAAVTTTTSSASQAAPPPPATSTAAESSSTCGAPAVTTQTVFVVGTSTGTVAPTETGLSTSTATGSSEETTVITQVTTETASTTTYVSNSAAATTFTVSDGSQPVPTPSNPPHVTQISDGQPQAQTPSVQTPSGAAAATTSPVVTQISDGQPQATSPAAAATSTIGDNPSIEPVPTDSTASFTFQPSSTSTVTPESSASSAAATSIAITSAASTSAQVSSGTASSVASATGTTTSGTSAAAATSTATSTTASSTFGSAKPTGACAPTGSKRVSKVFGNRLQAREDAAFAALRQHARQWRAGDE